MARRELLEQTIIVLHSDTSMCATCVQAPSRARTNVSENFLDGAYFDVIWFFLRLGTGTDSQAQLRFVRTGKLNVISNRLNAKDDEKAAVRIDDLKRTAKRAQGGLQVQYVYVFKICCLTLNRCRNVRA